MTFVEFLNKALTERRFANRVVADPEGALREVGIDPTQDRLDALRNASQALQVAKIIFDTNEADNL